MHVCVPDQQIRKTGQPLKTNNNNNNNKTQGE